MLQKLLYIDDYIKTTPLFQAIDDVIQHFFAAFDKNNDKSTSKIYVWKS